MPTNSHHEPNRLDLSHAQMFAANITTRALFAVSISVQYIHYLEIINSLNLQYIPFSVKRNYKMKIIIISLSSLLVFDRFSSVIGNYERISENRTQLNMCSVGRSIFR